MSAAPDRAMSHSMASANPLRASDQALASPVSGFDSWTAGWRNRSHKPSQFAEGGATAASGWLLRLSASATKPSAFISSTNPRRYLAPASRPRGWIQAKVPTSGAKPGGGWRPASSTCSICRPKA